VPRANGTPLRHIAAYVPPALYERLRALADDHGYTVSDVVTDAIRRYLAEGARPDVPHA
jgi:predicted DNA-binding protein